MIRRFEKEKDEQCNSLPVIIIGCIITYTAIVYFYPSMYINYP